MRGLPTLMRALERESRLLTRAMLEEDDRCRRGWRNFQERARKSMQWIWGLVFGLGSNGSYALYTEYVIPWQDHWKRRDSAGRTCWACWYFRAPLERMAIHDHTSRGAGNADAAGIGFAFFRRRIRRVRRWRWCSRDSAWRSRWRRERAASETRKGQSASVSSEETIKGDIFLLATA